MIAIYLAMFIASRIKKSNKVSISHSYQLKYRYLFVTIASLIIIYLLNKSLLGSIGVFTGEVDTDLLAESNSTSGIIRLLTGFLLFSSFILLFDFFAKKNKYILAIIVSYFYIFMILISSIRISRWAGVISFVSILSICLIRFPKYKKVSILLFVLPGLLVFALLTFLKNGNGMSDSLSNNVLTIFDYNLLNAYFSGFQNVSTCVSIKNANLISFRNLFFDIGRSIPGVLRLFNINKTSNYIFNNYLYYNIGRNDAIIPLIGQSYIYLGFFLSPLLSSLFAFFSIRCDRAFKKTNDIRKYLFAYMAVALGVAPLLNITIMLSWFIQTIAINWLAILVFSNRTRVTRNG